MIVADNSPQGPLTLTFMKCFHSFFYEMSLWGPAKGNAELSRQTVFYFT